MLVFAFHRLSQDLVFSAAYSLLAELGASAPIPVFSFLLTLRALALEIHMLHDTCEKKNLYIQDRGLIVDQRNDSTKAQLV